MAPQPGHTIDQTPEYVEFIGKLREYHAKRGTNFEPEPKVGQTPVDLLKLFKVIVEHGGYDKISEEKLAWRNMVNALELYSNNEASAAYSLKLAYYKNLAAYEITTIHKQEPPPPEILEHISAKGGGLLTRTLENFGGHRATMRPSGGFDSPMGGTGSSSMGDPMGTPTRQDHAAAGPDGTPLSGRASRGLREAPAQRVIFQPDTASTRQSRHASGQQAGSGAHAAGHHGPPGHHHLPGAPQGAASFGGGMHPNQNHHGLPPHQQQQQQLLHRNASMVYNPPNSDIFSSAVQAYEPRGPVPIVLQLAEAPANAPAKFLQQNRLQRLQASGVSLSRFAARPPVPPGSEGPNIYVRCLGALRSGLQAEEAFALSHLVKISYERGDKYKFESFPGLAEGLVEKALQVGSLFYHDVAWTVSYDADGGGDDADDVGELDGVHGTPDILERIAQLRPRARIDCLQTEAFADQMVLITEAALTVRNMVTLPENAYFVADFAPCRDFLCIALNLPDRDAVVELKHCALDIAEQLTPFLVLGDDDPLYRTLLRQLASPDRGMVLTALRAIGRISMNLAETNRLGGVPPSVLQRVTQWLLLNDDELMDACLDFLYQYTAVAANVERLLRAVRAEGLVSHLVRLLSHGAKRSVKELVLQPERRLPAADEVLALPPDLLTRLVATDEPERCYTWLRCFFEEDPDSSITQIAIWQAYQSSFLQPVQQSGRTMLGAAEFIRNVTHVYHAAGAQIQKEQTPQGEVQKFIIKGIRPRRRPISPEGQEFFRCQWRMPAASAAPASASASASASAPLASPSCGIFFGAADKLYAHILQDHVGETPDADGKVANVKDCDVRCLWAGCRKYPKGTKMPLADFMKHIKTHAVQSEQDIRQNQKQVQQPQQQDAPASAESGSPADGSNGAAQPSNPLKHQRQRSSVSNGDLLATGGAPGSGGAGGSSSSGTNGAASTGANGTPNGTSPNGGTVASGGGGTGAAATTPNKRQKRSYVVPAKTISVAYEETATMRDERNPNLPAQAAGIPLSAVLVLRNMARNASKAEVVLDERGQVVLLDDDDEWEQQQQQQQHHHHQQEQQHKNNGTSGKRSKPSLPGTPSSSSGLLPPATSSKFTGGAAGGARHAHSPADAAAAAAAQEAGGWNERLFRPVLPRLYEIMSENRALATYIASLFQLIGEDV
ncbi:chromatin structure-remodeling complex subunit RSC9 [Sporothrix schenckii 1099-18]|uniref:Chromatin structure-remodeling complex subunit RSC9 n=1 Tax=Sporothrix schenckii 1099-18 TaxID=1397361 RepID=A0A0F2LTV8_SPOSC|nr:chromatin structure-remodeling complex subunit RSC9 [Sporothrix schenckii 1099-18]KJR80913.1 chromatin structure-remodeling complex subunit RSC9 [Sporothrix schenckii 1099-18]